MKQDGNLKIPELLAPAGSFEIMKQAFQAGADAVYLGGPYFGARAYAANLTENELLYGIEYAKLHHKKLYLTVNTLFKNEDIDRLFAYLKVPYEAGLDAVIVQDFGVLSVLRELFPAMELHASTQMSVTSVYGAELLRTMGVNRIVPARELGIDELRRLKRDTGMELEVFVHGALCYSYSGHCLLSSMIGGRSGNRGRCAQPCRQLYSLSDGRSGYYLSPRDLCALPVLPELMEAGMDSFKIEGRMKKPEYVIGAVDAYRRAIDAWADHQKFDWKAEQERLADIYNRGNFTEGYFHFRNGQNMMAMERNHHNGILLGVVHSIKENQIRIRLNRDMNSGDILEIRGSSQNNAQVLTELTAGAGGSAGEIVSLKGRQLRQIHSGDCVYRTKNNQLCRELLRNNESRVLKEKINVSVTLKKDLSAMIKMVCGEVSVTVSGGTVTRAEKHPLTRAAVLEKLYKLGDAPFVINSVEFDMDEDCFYPMKEWNQLRRQALTELETRCSSIGRRTIPEERSVSDIHVTEQTPKDRKFEAEMLFAAGISTWEQFECVLDTDSIQRMDLESESFSRQELNEMLAAVHQKEKIGYISLPRMFRMEYEPELLALLELPAEGYVVRTVDLFAFVKSRRPEAAIVCDYSVYAYNQEAAAAYFRLGKSLSSETDAIHLTLPVELNRSELQALLQDTPSCSWEWILYGAQPVMITAQCSLRNCNKDACSRGDHVVSGTDDLLFQNSHGDCLRVHPICKFCYNVIYQYQPVCLLSIRDALSLSTIRTCRIQFTIEDRAETVSVLQLLNGQSEMQGSTSPDGGRYTGHYRKGIE